MNTRPESKIEAHLNWRVAMELDGITLKLEVEGRRGWPDRIVLLPVGVTFYVELKAKRGKPSRLQRVRRRQLEVLNQPYALLSSIAEVDAWVEQVKASTAEAMAEIQKGSVVQ